jgi:hypothetical protein
MHLAVGRFNWILGKIISGSFSNVATGTFSPSLPKDTVLTCDALLSGNTATLHLPNNTVVPVTDSVIGSEAGSWATIEAFQLDAAADDKIKFTKAWAA